MGKLTEIEMVLVEKLRKIENDRYFIIGTLCDLKDDIERQAVIDYIERYKDDEEFALSSSEINLLSVWINAFRAERENNLMYSINYFHNWRAQPDRDIRDLL